LASGDGGLPDPGCATRRSGGRAGAGGRNAARELAVSEFKDLLLPLAAGRGFGVDWELELADADPTCPESVSPRAPAAGIATVADAREPDCVAFAGISRVVVGCAACDGVCCCGGRLNQAAKSSERKPRFRFADCANAPNGTGPALPAMRIA